MNEHKYTVTVPMPKGAFEAWANQYRQLQEEFAELQLETTGYKDAIDILRRIQKLPDA
jgi:hypothetical protein